MTTLLPGRLIPGCQFWCRAKDGDPECYALARRHYSAKKNRNPKIKQFVGPGTPMVLVSPEADALFVWRKFIDDSGQRGINCAIFRNESRCLSSEMIHEADRLADDFWPGDRHYTYVDRGEILSPNPGYCFICAGWNHCGVTKRGLMILERRAA